MIEKTELDKKLRTINETAYSSSLVRASNMTYYLIKDRMLQGYRISTAGEELKIQLAFHGKNIRGAKDFNDLFAKNPAKYSAWQWTESGLRATSGWEKGRYETDKNSNKKYPRIILIGEKEVGEILVPEGNNRVIVEWDEAFGIPAETREIPWPHEPYATHFIFNSTPFKDNISDHYDIALGRRAGWHRNVGERCLAVDACYGRSDASSDGGFRLVRGSLPEIEGISSNVDVEQVRRKILRKALTEFAADLENLSTTEFMKKYQL